MTKSLTGTVGKPLVHFIQLSALSIDKYKPSSVPRNNRFGDFLSCMIDSA